MRGVARPRRASVLRSRRCMPDLARRLAVARGDEPADLVVRGGRVLLGVHARVARDRRRGRRRLRRRPRRLRGRGDARRLRPLRRARASSTRTCTSSRRSCCVDEFARLVLPLGTTTVVVDPHEIANVLGTDGVHWLLDVCGELPLDVYFMASSSVPASTFESPRRPLSPGDLEGLLRRRRVIGLAEMMNFPGVVSGDPHELAKLALPGRRARGRARARRAGRTLNAYAAAGIRSDHEAFTIEEGRERLRAGMWLLIREASAARNLHALLPLAREYGPGADRLLHRRPRARAHRRGRPHQHDGARRRRRRDPAGGCARDVDPQPGHLARARAPRRDRTRLSGRPAPAARPRALRAGCSCSSAAFRSARSSAWRCPSG